MNQRLLMSAIVGLIVFACVVAIAVGVLTTEGSDGATPVDHIYDGADNSVLPAIIFEHCPGLGVIGFSHQTEDVPPPYTDMYGNEHQDAAMSYTLTYAERSGDRRPSFGFWYDDDHVNLYCDDDNGGGQEWTAAEWDEIYSSTQPIKKES